MGSLLTIQYAQLPESLPIRFIILHIVKGRGYYSNDTGLRCPSAAIELLKLIRIGRDPWGYF